LIINQIKNVGIMMKSKLTQIVLLFASITAVYCLTSCENEDAITNGPAPNKIDIPSKDISPDSFLNAPGKSIFYWQTNEFICSEDRDSMTFKGFVYDTMAYFERDPIPSGKFYADNQTFEPGPEDVNYEYNKDETVSSRYSGSQIDVRLDNDQGNPVYDTTIKILERVETTCHTDCINENTCFEVSTTFQSDYAGIIVTNAGSGENIRSVKKLAGEEGKLNQICFDGLLGKFSPGDKVTVKILRAKYYYIIGNFGKLHKLASTAHEQRTYKVCK
jgi:hypothetical protein